MPGHNYHQITVQGGDVQAGDRYINNQYLVLDDSSPIDVRALLHNLTKTAQLCDSINTNVVSVDGSSTSLKELVHDVVDLQAAVGTLQILIEDQTEDVNSMASACQEHLSNLCASMAEYKETMAVIGQETYDWCTATQSDSGKGIARPSPADVFAVRERLSRIRRKLNLTVSIVNWSLVQSFRQQSSVQFQDMLQHLMLITDQLENQRLKDIPPSLPLNQTNMLPLSQHDHSKDYLREYLSDGSSDTSTIRAPSMQVSILDGSSKSMTCTFVSAAERFVFSSRASVMAISMQVFVCGLPDIRTMVLSVYLDDTIDELTKEVRKRSQLPSLCFRLCHTGRCLEGKSTVRGCGIKPLSTLQCVGLSTPVHRTCDLCVTTDSQLQPPPLEANSPLRPTQWPYPDPTTLPAILRKHHHESSAVIAAYPYQFNFSPSVTPPPVKEPPAIAIPVRPTPPLKVHVVGKPRPTRERARKAVREFFRGPRPQRETIVEEDEGWVRWA